MAKTSLGTSHYGNDYGISETLGNFAHMLDPKIAAEAALNRQHGELYAAQKLHSVAATDKLKAETELLKMRSAALNPDKLVELYGPVVAQAVMASQPKNPSEILEALTKMKVLDLAGKGDADSLRLAAILNKTPGATSSKASFSTSQGAQIEADAASAKLAQIVKDRELANAAILKKAEIDNAGRAALDKAKPVIVPSGASAIFDPKDIRNPALNTPAAEAPSSNAITEGNPGVSLSDVFKPDQNIKSFDFWGSKITPSEITPDNPFAISPSNLPNTLQDNGPSLSMPPAGIETAGIKFDNEDFLAKNPGVPEFNMGGNSLSGLLGNNDTFKNTSGVGVDYNGGGFNLNSPAAGLGGPNIQFDEADFNKRFPVAPYSPPALAEEKPGAYKDQPIPDAIPDGTDLTIRNTDGSPATLFDTPPQNTAPAAKRSPTNVFTSPGKTEKPMAVSPDQGVFDPVTRQWIIEPGKKVIRGSSSGLYKADGTELVPPTVKADKEPSPTQRNAANKEIDNGVVAVASLSKKGVGHDGLPRDVAIQIVDEAKKAYPRDAVSIAVARYAKENGLTIDENPESGLWNDKPKYVAKLKGVPFAPKPTAAKPAVTAPKSPVADVVVPADAPAAGTQRPGQDAGPNSAYYALTPEARATAINRIKATPDQAAAKAQFEIKFGVGSFDHLMQQ